MSDERKLPRGSNVRTVAFNAARSFLEPEFVPAKEQAPAPAVEKPEPEASDIDVDAFVAGLNLEQFQALDQAMERHATGVFGEGE